jgi:hypothetical protein
LFDGAKKSFFKGGKRDDLSGWANVWSGQVALTPLAVFEPEGSQEDKGGSFCCWAAAAFQAKREAIVRIRRKEDIENLDKTKEFLRMSTQRILK